jgi:hypothetical protein
MRATLAQLEFPLQCRIISSLFIVPKSLLKQVRRCFAAEIPHLISLGERRITRSAVRVP